MSLIGDAYIKVAADTGGFRSELQRGVEAAASSVEADVEVKADSDGLRGEVSRAAAIAGAGQEIDIDLNVEDGGSIGRSSSALQGFIGSAGRANVAVRFLSNSIRLLKWPLIITGATLAAQALGALGGAAVAVISSLSALAGALAALPGLLSAVAQGIGSVLLASSGIGKALKAMGTEAIRGGGAASGGANKAAQALKRQQDATERVEDATRALALTERDAARDIEDANEAIADAVEDLARAREDAAEEAEDSARRIEDATRSLARAEEDAADRIVDANRRVEDAKRDLIDAQQDAKRAQEDLTRARERAADRLEDLQLRARGLAVDESQALRDVQRAQALLDRNRGSSNAQILVDQLEEAKIALERIRLEQGRTKDEMEEFNKTGIDGAEEVKTAEERLADSLERVADAERKIQEAAENRADAQVEGLERVQDAQRNLQDAQREAIRQQEDSARRIIQAERSLADARENAADTQIDAQERIEDAQRALTEAIEDSKTAMEDFGAAGGGAMSAVASAMAALPKSAQEFVKFLYSLKPLLDDLRKTAADNLFPGLTEAIKTSLVLFPIFKEAVGQTAKAIADLAVSGAKMISAPAFASDIQKILGQNVVTIRQFGEAGLKLADALRNIMVAAIPLVNFLGELAIRLSENVRVFAETNRENGKLATFFEQTRAVIERVISIGANLMQTFFNIGKAGTDLGNDLLASFDKITGGWKEWTGSVEGQNRLKEFFDNLRPTLTELGALISDLGGILIRVLENPKLPEFIRKFREELLPTIEKILTTASEKFGPAFSDALSGMSKLLDQLINLPGLPGFISAIGLAAGAIADLIKNVPGLDKLLAGFLAINGVLGAAKFLTFAAGVAKASSAITLLTSVFSGLRIVIGLLSIALGVPLGPILLIGAAIAGLVYLVVKNWDTIKEATAKVWDWFKEHIDTIVRVVVGILTGGLSEMVMFVVRNWDEIKAKTSEVWNGIKDFLSGLWEGIKNVASTVWQAIVSFMSDRWANLKNNTLTVWNAIKDFLSNLWETIKNTVRDKFLQIQDNLDRVWEGIKGKVREAWENIKESIRNAIENVVNTVRDLPGRVVSGLGNLRDLLWDKGQDIVQGLINGVKSMGRTLINAILRLIPGPIRGVVSSALGISSPSTVFAGFGKNIVQGMIEGVAQQQPALLRELQGMADDVARTNFAVPDIEAAVNATGRGSVTGTDRNGAQRQFGNVQIIIQDSQNPQRTAQAVVRALQGESDPMVRRTLVKELHNQNERIVTKANQ